MGSNPTTPAKYLIMDKLEAFIENYNVYSYPINYPFFVKSDTEIIGGMFNASIIVSKLIPGDVNEWVILFKITKSCPTSDYGYKSKCIDDLLKAFNSVDFKQYLI